MWARVGRVDVPAEVVGLGLAGLDQRAGRLGAGQRHHAAADAREEAEGHEAAGAEAGGEASLAQAVTEVPFLVHALPLVERSRDRRVQQQPGVLGGQGQALDVAGDVARCGDLEIEETEE